MIKTLLIVLLASTHGFQKPLLVSLPGTPPRSASAVWVEPPAQPNPQYDPDSSLSRRLFFASGLVSTGAFLLGGEVSNAYAEKTNGEDVVQLPWVKDPINPKRSGLRLKDAEKIGYSDSFVTYLTRFLFNFDPLAQQWWIEKAKEIPSSSTLDDIFAIRNEQFGRFSASVELGLLQEFSGSDGPTKLLQDLLKRYSVSNAEEGADDAKYEGTRRETKEARRQLALLFALLPSSSQPVKEITKLLASVDNASIVSVRMLHESEAEGNMLRGYAPDETPVIEFRHPKQDLLALNKREEQQLWNPRDKF